MNLQRESYIYRFNLAYTAGTQCDIQDFIVDSRPTVFIGNGFSYAAAETASALNDKRGTLSKAIRPTELTHTIAYSSNVTLISWKGKSADILSATNFLGSHRPLQLSCIIGSVSSKLEETVSNFDNIDSRILKPKATFRAPGFINTETFFFQLGQIASVYSTSSDTYDLSGNKQFMEYTTRLSSILAARYSCIYILHGKQRIADALVLSGLLLESGLANSSTHEIRDFLHGRYISAYGNQPVAFILIPCAETYETACIIQRRFQNASPVWVSLPPTTDIVGTSYSFLATASIATEAASRSRGYSLSNPKKPIEMKNWGNWGRPRLR